MIDKKTQFNVSEKKPTLYLTIGGLWLFIMGSSVPALWRNFNELSSIPAKILFILFVMCIFLFWFYGIYHLVFLIFAYERKTTLLNRAHSLSRDIIWPKVAIIYATYNDFNSEAALTCLGQDYPSYHVFLLDVSTNPDIRKQVDAFHEKHTSATTLVRLQPRQGFKARSLNDMLRTAVTDDYLFFVVCDADNRLPGDFLSSTVPYFFSDERIAFVQANHASGRQSQERFAKDFEDAIEASWYLHQLPRDKYGLLMCMGHSVVVRRDAWQKVGGYPEIVQEDTAFTIRLREHGYYGLFAPEVICGEEFPEDFTRFRRRQFRLVQADGEIFSTQMPQYLKSKSISLVEKIDLLARTIRIPAQSLALPFLLLTFVLIPLANEGTVSTASIDRALVVMLSPAPILYTLLLAAAPLYPFLVYLRRQIWKLFGLSLRSITLHYSIMAIAAVSLLVYLFRGKAMFVVTGSSDGAAVPSQTSGMAQGFLQRLNASSMLITVIDILAGLILGYVGIISGSLILIGVATVLLISPILKRLAWHNRIAFGLVYLPPVLVIAGLVTGLSGVMGTQSQYLVLAVCTILLF